MSEISKIPDKLYFRIGEVAKMIGVEPYVLRYWETEFPDITPVKSKAKQRLYKRQDVELIYKIRDLLYQQKFTIKGAKRKLQDNKKVTIKESKSSPQIDLKLESKSEEFVTPLAKKAIKEIIAEMDEFLRN